MSDDLDRDRLQRSLGRAARASTATRPSPGRVLRHDGVAVQVAHPGGGAHGQAAPWRRAAHGGRLARPRRRVGARPPRPGLAAAPPGRGRRRPLSSSPPTSTSCCWCAGSTGRSPPVGSSEGRPWRGTPVPTRSSCSPRRTSPTTCDGLDGRSPPSTSSTPGSSGSCVSSVTGLGIDALRERLAGHTSVMLGESGAGKSRLVNAVLGTDAAVVGRRARGRPQGSPHHHEPPAAPARRRRGGDRLARHPRGRAGRRRGVGRRHLRRHRRARRGVLLRRLRPRRRARAAPSPWPSRPASCRPIDSRRTSTLRKEAASAARRADEHERRTYERGFTKVVKAHVQQKPSNRQ